MKTTPRTAPFDTIARNIARVIREKAQEGGDRCTMSGRLVQFKCRAHAVPELEPRATPTRGSNAAPGTFEHPERIPTADAMLDEISDERSGDTAACYEHLIYLVWARIQAAKLGLPAPESLSSDEFAERYYRGAALPRLGERKQP